MATVRKFFEAASSKGDLCATDALLAPGFTLHVPLPVSVPGTDTINNVITTCRAAFSGLHMTIDDIMADGDTVTCRCTACRVHRREFMGLPATGKNITMTGIEIFRIRDVKIAELRGEANPVGLMQQPGIIPASA